MKFINKILAQILPLLQRFKLLKGRISASGLLAIICILLMLMVLWMLLGGFVFGKQMRAQKALDLGQRLEIVLESGEVTGKVLTVDTDIAKSDASKPDKPQDETTKPDQEPQTNDVTEAPEDSAAANELAWIKNDFIGPRMTDQMIEAYVGEGVLKEKIKIETVNIKDLSEKPIVVIIIKGMGLSSSSTTEALALPKEITMGFSPYSPNLDEWVKKTRATGHEVILNIPMETKDYRTDNPGPYSLLAQSSADDNNARLKMLLGLTSEYKAIYSETTEVFTRAANSVQPMLELLKKEGKYFVYGGGYENYTLVQVAESLEYPILISDLVLDDDISANAINDKLIEMEKIAKEKHYVVVMAHPYPITVRMLQAWLPKAAEKNLVVQPVSLLLGSVFK